MLVSVQFPFFFIFAGQKVKWLVVNETRVQYAPIQKKNKWCFNQKYFTAERERSTRSVSWHRGLYRIAGRAFRPADARSFQSPSGNPRQPGLAAPRRTAPWWWPGYKVSESLPAIQEKMTDDRAIKYFQFITSIMLNLLLWSHFSLHLLQMSVKQGFISLSALLKTGRYKIVIYRRTRTKSKSEIFTVSDCPLRSSSSCWYFMAGVFPLAWISFFRAWATSSLRLRAVALMPGITSRSPQARCRAAFTDPPLYPLSDAGWFWWGMEIHCDVTVVTLPDKTDLSHTPVVRIEMSTNPVLGSVADCLRASRCSLLASSTSMDSTFSEKRTLAWASARRIRDSSCLG